MKKIKYLLFLIFIIIILLVIYYFYSSKKNTYFRIINNEFKKLETNLTVNDDKTLKISDELSFNLDGNEEYKNIIGESYIEFINDLKININAIQKNGNFKLDYNTKYKDTNLIDISLYKEDKSIYIDLINIFNKYIYIPIDYDFEDPKIKYILNKIKTNFINNSNEDDFIKTKEKINNLNVNKIEYILNEKKLANILINVLEDNKDDEKFVTYCSEILNISEKEFSSTIEDELKSLKKETDFDEKTYISFSIYTEGLLNKYIGFQLDIDDDLKIKTYNENNVIKGNIIIDDIKINFVNKNNIINYDLKYNELIIDGKIEKKSTNEIENLMIEINIKEDNIKAKLKINNVLKKEYTNEIFTNILTKQYVSYKNITEEDMNKIYTNIGNNENLTILIDKLNPGSYYMPELIEN